MQSQAGGRQTAKVRKVHGNARLNLIVRDHQRLVLEHVAIEACQRDSKADTFLPSFILLWVRWYLNFNVSYRHLAEMMQERGFAVHHNTITGGSRPIAPQLEELIRWYQGHTTFLLARARRVRHSICSSEKHQVRVERSTTIPFKDAPFRATRRIAVPPSESPCRCLNVFKR